MIENKYRDKYLKYKRKYLILCGGETLDPITINIKYTDNNDVEVTHSVSVNNDTTIEEIIAMIPETRRNNYHLITYEDIPDMGIEPYIYDLRQTVSSANIKNNDTLHYLDISSTR